METPRVAAKVSGLRFAKRLIQALEGKTRDKPRVAASTRESAVPNAVGKATDASNKNRSENTTPARQETPPPPRSDSTMASKDERTGPGRQRARAVRAADNAVELAIPDDEDDNQSAQVAQTVPLQRRTQRTQRKPAVAKASSKTQSPTVDTRRDEALFRLVVETHGLDATQQVADETWLKIQRWLSRRGVAVLQCGGPKERVEWLVQVYKNAVHSEHKNLTPVMKDLVATYMTSGLHEALGSPEAPVEISLPTPPRLQSSLNHIIVHETLRLKAFRTNDWEAVATAVNERMKSKLFPLGTLCQRHVAVVLSRIDFSDLDGVDEMTGIERKVLKALWVGMMIQWPANDSLLTSTHSTLLNTVDEYLNQDSTDAGTLESAEEQVDEEKVAEEDSPHSLQRNDDEDTEPEDMGLRPGSAFGRRGPSPHVPPPKSRKRRRASIEQDDSSDNMEPMYRRSEWLRLKKEMDQRLEAESDARKRLEASIREERTEWREERKEFQRVIATMTEALKTERIAQRDETRALLDLIEKERDGRRSEFVAMMDLVTRAVLPPSVPSRRGKVVENDNGADSEPTADGRL